MIMANIIEQKIYSVHKNDENYSSLVLYIFLVIKTTLTQGLGRLFVVQLSPALFEVLRTERIERRLIAGPAGRGQMRAAL